MRFTSKLFTQNSDLRKGGIFGWTLPAHWVTLPDGTKFNTCPNAGACAGFCYAKNGTYQFPEVKKNHLLKLDLVLNHREAWFHLIMSELVKKKYKRKFILIHDAGDFFSEDYALDWLRIARANPQCRFYTYTKEVELFKYKLVKKIPANFIVIFSYGGRQDFMIDRENDRHSDVFPDYDNMIAEGYNDIGDDDKLAAIHPNKKVGLFRNNIPHFIKKMGDRKFSDFNAKRQGN